MRVLQSLKSCLLFAAKRSQNFFCQCDRFVFYTNVSSVNYATWTSFCCPMTVSFKTSIFGPNIGQSFWPNILVTLRWAFIYTMRHLWLGNNKSDKNCTFFTCWRRFFRHFVSDKPWWVFSSFFTSCVAISHLIRPFSLLSFSYNAYVICYTPD